MVGGNVAISFALSLVSNPGYPSPSPPKHPGTLIREALCNLVLLWDPQPFLGARQICSLSSYMLASWLVESGIPMSLELVLDTSWFCLSIIDQLFDFSELRSSNAMFHQNPLSCDVVCVDDQGTTSFVYLQLPPL